MSSPEKNPSRLIKRVAFLLLGVLVAARGTAAVKEGDAFPRLDPAELRVLAGGTFPETAGKVVLVDFWASWCGPCVLSMPELDAMRRRLIDDGFGERFEILGVNLDQDIDKAQAFLKVHPVAYPVIHDVAGIASQLYAPRKLPSAYLVGLDGRVAFIYYGYGSGYGSEVEERVRAALKAKKAGTEPPAAP